MVNLIPTCLFQPGNSGQSTDEVGVMDFEEPGKFGIQLS